MDKSELLSRIRVFPLLARSLSDDLFAGNFRSLFKGKGIEFDEARRYERGDDVRSIDWNVTARFGTPFVKLYREEREMTLCLVLDCSASMFAAASSPSGLSRFDQAVLAASLLAFSAEWSGIRAAAVFFDRGVVRCFPPRKGRPHIMSLVREALDARPRERGSGLGEALSRAGSLLKRRSLVAVISDFLAADWEGEFFALAKRHDVAAIAVTDSLDERMPRAGLLTLEDAETGLSVPAPTGSKAFREAWEVWQKKRARERRAVCLRSGAAWVELSTSEDAASTLRRFFRERQ